MIPTGRGPHRCLPCPRHGAHGADLLAISEGNVPRRTIGPLRFQIHRDDAVAAVGHGFTADSTNRTQRRVAFTKPEPRQRRSAVKSHFVGVGLTCVLGHPRADQPDRPRPVGALREVSLPRRFGLTGRSHRARVVALPVLHGVIPACVGNGTTPRPAGPATPGHPCVRGEQLRYNPDPSNEVGPSPRARGADSLTC
jgi:hypothetical protein